MPFLPPPPTTTFPPQNKKVTEFLKTILGRPVVVKLNSGVDYRGTFRGEWMGGAGVRRVLRGDDERLLCGLE